MPTSISSPTPDSKDRSFDEQSQQALLRLRGVFEDLLCSLNLAPPKPQLLAKGLGIDKNLAWKITKVIQQSDPFSAFLHLPGSSGIEIFIKAAEKRGTDPKLITTARKAIQELNQVIERHTGDRATLEMMVGGLAREGRRDILIAHRKQLYKGASSVWGIQAKAQLMADFIAPNESNPELFDLAWVAGFIELKRLRSGVPWLIGRHRCIDDTATSLLPTGTRRALDPAYVGAESAPLLPEFCSQPLPDLRRFNGADGFIYDELVEGPVGNTAAVTCITAELIPQMSSMRKSENNTFGEIMLAMRTPVETLIFDLFVHESYLSFLSPTLHIYSLLEGGPEFRVPGRQRMALPFEETIQDLGQPPVVQTAVIPKHVEIVDTVFQRTGWNPAEFRAFRAMIPYPPAPSSILMHYDLADH
ncbi:MAG: hypothetical protein MI923_15485 [Phycisphaerales bacterium]|nr:hypothetical protein [Phycisphaerales bacterium]